MIIQPHKEIEVVNKLQVGMKGFLRVKILRPDGRVRWDSGFFPNKILDSGRNNMATQASWLNWCHVGTDSTPPVAGHTQLLGFVVATNSIPETTYGTQGSAPFYGWKRQTFRFNVGAGHGGQNLSEAGIGWGSAGSVLVSRALIIDPITQLPTTITPLADELLEITYELRYYPPLIDVINSVTLNGVNYDTTTRAASVTDNSWNARIGLKIEARAISNGSWAAYDGLLGTIEQNPNGLSANCDNAGQYSETYVNNSYQTVMVCNCGYTGWNLGAGIRCIRVYTSAGTYQTQFDSNPGGTTIPKTGGFTMIMKWVLGWTEYV